MNIMQNVHQLWGTCAPCPTRAGATGLNDNHTQSGNDPNKESITLKINGGARVVTIIQPPLNIRLEWGVGFAIRGGARRGDRGLQPPVGDL